jgi:ferrous iron transport protein B
MLDIARRRGIDIDVDRMSAELGVPVVTAAAGRRGSTNELLLRLDKLAADDRKSRAEDTRKSPTTSELRAAQRETDRIIRLVVRTPAIVAADKTGERLTVPAKT